MHPVYSVVAGQRAGTLDVKRKAWVRSYTGVVGWLRAECPYGATGGALLALVESNEYSVSRRG